MPQSALHKACTSLHEFGLLQCCVQHCTELTAVRGAGSYMICQAVTAQSCGQLLFGLQTFCAVRIELHQLGQQCLLEVPQRSLAK